MTVNEVICGDAMEVMCSMPDAFADCCVTSPPYFGLRDYGTDGQIGAEESPDEYISRLVDVFREVRRVLKDDGTLWINIGDSYATSSGSQPPTNTRNQCGHTKKKVPSGYKYKDIIGIPWMLAFALRADGWYLRQDIIWSKPNPMPESVRDRCTKSHEYVFLLSKSPIYYFDRQAIAEPVAESTSKRLAQSGSLRAMRNKRDVWRVSTRGFNGNHFATYPPELILPCILAGSRKGGIVLDPFLGSGTTALVAQNEGRNYIGIEISPSYCEMARQRISDAAE